jgi:hypothetical protein
MWASHRLFALVAALLTLLMPPVIAAAIGGAHHAHGSAAASGDHAGHSAVADPGAPSVGDAQTASLWCQVACAALQALPVASGVAAARVALVSPETRVAQTFGRVAAPELPPPRPA